MKTITAITRHGLSWASGLLAICATLVSSAIVPYAGAQVVAPRISSEISSAERSTLKDSLHPLAQAQYDAGRLGGDTRLNGITMVFARSATQEAALQNLIAAQQNPASPSYHQWLTPDQFAARFGMADSDLNKVENWLQEQGFAIDQVARGKDAIHFSGTARQVEQAFATEMHNYKINGTRHYAPSTALSVPSAFASTVLGIKNLDDFHPRAQVQLRKNMNANLRTRGSFTGAGSTNSTNEVILFAPGDIRVAYDINPLYNESITGSGQSLTIIGQSAVQTADLEAFQTNAGLSIKDPTPFLVPNSGDSTIQADGDEAESDLDLEWSNAIAPGATINFVYVGNNQSYSAFDSIEYAIDEKIGTIISSSYGTCEAALDGQTLESFLEKGASQGQTIMSAAGDDGSTDCYGIPGLTTAEQEAQAVDYPASSPNVTGVGGTEVSNANSSYLTVGDGYWESDSGNSDIVNSVLKYIPEMAWNDDQSNCGQTNCLSSGGGGASILFTKPTWQTGVTGIPSDGHRDVPDVALYASPENPGYLFCSSDSSAWAQTQTSSCTSGFEDINTGYLTAAGGTSFAAPIFSGVLALINQKQGYTTGQGLINKTLYSMAADSATYALAFHDITTGNNDCNAGSANCANSDGFSAGVGYDQVTGLGSIDATNLATAWPASSGSTLISTTTTITAANSAPNVNASDSFTVTVTGTSGTPSGSITLAVDGGTPITETLASNGTYVYTTSFATAGAHTILAAYVADSTYAASTGSVTVEVATISSGSGTIAVSASPSTLTVAQGSSGNETITVKPGGGYTGTVYLSFDTSNDSALQNLCYEFSDTNSAGYGVVPITSTASATTVLSLDANAADCATTAAMRPSGKHAFRALHPRNSAKNTRGNPLPYTVAFAGLLLIGFLGRSSRKLRGLVAVLALAVAGLAVSACGGVTNTTLSNPPTGTYTVTVTGADSVTSTITGSTTFTFVIN
jgi:subtilase family serine protease